MGSMYDNKVWTLVDLPDSRKAVENKWIFKRKTDADGNITVYKARLVAKGFRQIQGVDYDETFSPVAKLKSVRILLAIAAFFDYEIWQMDVKTAFLNGDIEEELYMVQPKGFVDPKNADMVCKLQRSIYGLKQASRSWNRRFDKVIKDFGFIQCHGEACIYKKVSGSSVAFLILYVDDILLIGNDIELLSSVKGYLNKCFSMKDLGEAAYILGIKIYRDRSRRLIGLSQSTYLDKILKKFRMDESKKGFLPMLPDMEYGMEFEVLFGVSDGIQDITRSSGMVRRMRFIYRKSYSKFGNDPVHLWKVLEGSRKVRKKRTMEGGVPEGLHNPGRPNPKGGVPGGLHLGWPATPPQGKVGVPP
ncbi:hypothetical protein QYE76_013029 [Lolium multiflorum]|uniref:Reverse transcriptase Ty1/copia-type domain-containing protein n=1 Tax=Lolium multiflorum TaxID=4521 RepID=A0AAD8X6U6_LOLMU|nr:hypothetical protein QYE76_013029 [Lolium multiflorum]